MTYPDRESADRRTVYLWTALILIVLVLFAAFSIEAMLKREVCIGASLVSTTEENWQIPADCE